MTAAIVYINTRTEMTHPEAFLWNGEYTGRDGDDYAGKFQSATGQLWERETERDANTELYARWMRLGDGQIKFFRTRSERERVHSILWGLTTIDDE
jgi:hypothetical protein